MKTAFGSFARKRGFLVLLLLGGGLALALSCSHFQSAPEIVSFGDLRQHGIALSTANLVTKRNKVRVVVALEPAQSVWRFLRPGRPVYAFDDTGQLLASTANDTDDPEFYEEWENQQKRPLTESELAGLFTASGKEFTEIVTGWRQVVGSL